MIDKMKYKSASERREDRWGILKVLRSVKENNYDDWRECSIRYGWHEQIIRFIRAQYSISQVRVPYNYLKPLRGRELKPNKVHGSRYMKLFLGEYGRIPTYLFHVLYIGCIGCPSIVQILNLNRHIYLYNDNDLIYTFDKFTLILELIKLW